MNHQRPTPTQAATTWGPAQRSYDPLLSVHVELERIKDILKDWFRAEQLPEAVFETVDYVLSQPGKLMRPGLVILCGQACGSLAEDHYHVGAILELIHNATLLHDDVIDCSDLRRGRTTANAHWGDLSAVLLGDVLLAVALDMCVDLPREVMRQVTGISKQVCMGELHQTLRFRHWDLELQEYIQIITDKTASFFQGACRIGAQLAQAEEARIEAMSEYGLCLGVAFQIRDDILDICGQQDQTGKPVGGDLRQERPTLPVLHYLDSHPKQRQSILAGTRTAQEWGDLLEESGSLEYARHLGRTYVERAQASLKGFEQTAAYEALMELARFTVERIA